jgi:hypothetical protein
MPPKEKLLWAKWMAELLQDSHASLQRSVTLKDALALPPIAGYADASTIACCVVVYVIWKLPADT